jgi:hypothetical protein
MRKLFLPFLVILLIISSCSTLRFGQISNIFKDETQKSDIRELDLSFNYQVFGVPVKGTKSAVESVFIHPDNKTINIFISFPRIGILTTNDFGKTFSAQFFKLSYLDKIYGYNYQPDNENEKLKGDKEKPSRYFYHFVVSPKDPNKIIISAGPYIFISKDKGNTWASKSIFFNSDSVNIRDIFITNKEELLILTENKIAVSGDWGKKWNVKSLSIDKNYFKYEYITGYYDNSTDTLISSLKFNEEQDSVLSQKSFEYLYKKSNPILKSGIFYSKNFGANWTKSSINVPLNIWKYKDKFYARSEERV